MEGKPSPKGHPVSEDETHYNHRGYPNGHPAAEHAAHWDNRPYYSLDAYLKQTFHEKIYRIALNGGMTCPNRDGTLGQRGCIFCSKGGSGEFAQPASLPITKQIEQGKALIGKKTKAKQYIAYFQAFTNTYAPTPYLEAIFTEAISHPDIVALSIATRPDCLDESVVQLLCKLNQRKPVWIELGLQTIHEKSATFIRRGYALPCFAHATARLKQCGIKVIAHTILGLPGETKAQMLETIDYVRNLQIFGIKLQMLHILKETDLASYYEAHPFPLFTMEGYTDLVTEIIGRLPKDLVIHRLTGDDARELLIEPQWSLQKGRTLNMIHHKLKQKQIWQGKYLGTVNLMSKGVDYETG